MVYNCMAVHLEGAGIFDFESQACNLCIQCSRLYLVGDYTPINIYRFNKHLLSDLPSVSTIDLRSHHYESISSMYSRIPGLEE